MTRGNCLQRLAIFAAMIAVAACSSTPTTVPTPTSTPPASSSGTTGNSSQGTLPTTPAPVAAPTPLPKTAPVLPAYLDPMNPLYKDRIVYFDYDAVLIADKFNGLLDTHAAFLSKNPSVHVSVEGNTDERGSAEYNLALGQRRADAVVKALVLRGASPAQLESKSWGKEKPAATGQDEASFAKNRRVELNYPDH